MSAQDNNLAISQPSFIGENGPATLISEKEKKKQQEELLKLAAALKAVESDLSKSKAATKEGGKIVPLNAPKGSDNGPSNTAFIDAIAAMVTALQDLQVKITQFEQKKASYEDGISKEQVALAQHNLQQAIQQLQKVQNESFWEKFAEAFVALFSAIAAVVTCNPELLIITAISILAMTGVMSKISQGVSDVLQDMGMSKETANAVAAAIVVVIVMVCSFGMGEAAAAETVAEETTTAVTEGTSAAADATTNVATDSSSLLQKIGENLKKLNIFSKLTPKQNMLIVAALQSVSSTGLITNIADAIMVDEKMSKKDREKVEEILSIIVAVIATIVSLGASSGMASTVKSASNIAEKLDVNLMKFSRALFQVAGYGQSLGGLAEAGMDAYRANLEKVLAIINANIGLIKQTIEMNNTQMSDDQKHDADIIKQQKVGDRSIMNLMKGEEGFANLFTQYSPV